jgi:hypothetical protein
MIFFVVFGHECGAFAEASDTAIIGDEARATALFSFPNCENNCAETSTLDALLQIVLEDYAAGATTLGSSHVSQGA